MNWLLRQCNCQCRWVTEFLHMSLEMSHCNLPWSVWLLFAYSGHDCNIQGLPIILRACLLQHLPEHLHSEVLPWTLHNSALLLLLVSAEALFLKPRFDMGLWCDAMEDLFVLFDTMVPAPGSVHTIPGFLILPGLDLVSGFHLLWPNNRKQLLLPL